MTAEFLQEDLLGRRWPIHLGMARGLRSGSGFSKMPPRRAVAMLSPLADALVTDAESRHRLQEVDPGQISPLFDTPDAIGSRTLSLLGLKSALGPGSMRFEAHEVSPRCFLPSSTQVVPTETERIQLLLHGRASPTEHALLESPLPELLPPPEGAGVDCSLADRLIVDSSQPVLAVLRERHHPGWRVETEDGKRLETLPVNQVHLGVVAPGGSTLKLSFVPPGLEESMDCSGLAWLLITLGLFRSRQASPSSPHSPKTTSPTDNANNESRDQ